MIKLKQRFPNYFSGFTPQVYEFNSNEELNEFIANPPTDCFLNRWKETEDFVDFEIDKHKINNQGYLKCNMLKTDMDNVTSRRFWVVAYIIEKNEEMAAEAVANG